MDKSKLAAAIMQNRLILKIPTPDMEAVRVHWDEKTQSVKQEIIPLTDIYENPTNNSAESKQ